MVSEPFSVSRQPVEQTKSGLSAPLTRDQISKPFSVSRQSVEQTKSGLSAHLIIGDLTQLGNIIAFFNRYTLML